MFKKDDYIVCGKYGVCKVDRVGPIELGGVSKDKAYYTLVPVYDDKSKAYIPIDSDKIIMRPVLTKQEASDLVDHIQDIEELWIDEEKRREIFFKESLYKYDCEEWVRLIKTIYVRKQERIAQGKKVTLNDERYLHMAEENLYGELAIALHMKKEEVEAFIADKVQDLEVAAN